MCNSALGRLNSSHFARDPMWFALEGEVFTFEGMDAYSMLIVLQDLIIDMTDLAYIFMN